MSASDPAVLVIEDEPPIRRLLRNTLGVQRWRVLEAADGREGLALAAAERPDVIILDLGLPDIDGLEVIRELRKSSAIPIVVLSSRDDEKGKVAALDLGADDYVTKPFGAEELVARLRTALRHRLQEEGVRPAFRSGELTVDLVHRQVTVRGAEVHLSPKEYEILAQLVRHAGKVLTHRHLMQTVWGGETDPQYLRVFVRQLRQKIEPDPERPTHILTETGVGYRLAAPA